MLLGGLLFLGLPFAWNAAGGWAVIAATLPARPHSSREFIQAMGAWLDENGVKADKSIVHAAYRKDVPIFCPAFSDCSAGFGLVHHQWHQAEHLTIDSVAEFHYSFMGATDPTAMESEARQLAGLLKGDQVNCVLLVPV